MVNVTFLNVTAGINKTLNAINKTLQGPVLISNAPPVPRWLQDVFLSLYAMLLILAIVLVAHYIYYARVATLPSHNSPTLHNRPTTIIIPIKNEKVETVVDIVRRIKSLNCNAEILIVSDDPPQLYREIRDAIESLGVPNVRVLRRTNPIGYRGVAMNWAVQHARGEVLIFLDVDSVPPRDLCTRASVVGDREIVFLGWDGYATVKTPIANLQLFLYRYLIYHVSIVGRHLSKHPIFALGSGIVVRKQFLQEIGGFCNCTADDYDISAKAYLHGGRVTYVQGPPVLVEVPAGWYSFRKQYTRWTYNSAHVLSTYLIKLLKTPMSTVHKLSILLNIATHPLAVLTTFATIVTGLALGFMGVLLPPFYILILQLALAASAVVQTFYIYRIAKLDGYRFLEVGGKLAKSTAVLLTLSPLLTVYALLGFLRRGIKWHVTPKGLAALGGRGLYELTIVAVLSLLTTAAVYLQNLPLFINSLSLLVISTYTYLAIVIPSSRWGRG